MARKTTTRGPVLSHRGRPVNMAALLAQHGNMRAAGNARMTARGDILDSKGEVIKTREQVAAEYYSKNPKAVPKAAASLNQPTHDMLSGKKAEVDPTTPVTFVQEVAQKNDLDSLKKFELGTMHEEGAAPNVIEGQTTGYSPNVKLTETPAKAEEKK